MRVKQLKKLLEAADDNDLVVTPNFDHSYTPVYIAERVTAITDKSSRTTLSEDHYSDLAEGEARIHVFVIN